jgi:hypothetical protein
VSEASINLLYEALGSPLGVVIQTDNPEGLRAKLYRLRDQADDPMLKEISIVISPSMPASQVWLVKRKI